MTRRRIRISGEDRWLVAAFALAAGIGAAAAGPSPTGQTVVDWILVIAGVGGAVWAAASAPWWAGVATAATAAALAPSVILVLIGSVAALVGLWIGSTKSSVPAARAWVAAVAVQVFARLGQVWKFGITAAVAIGVLAILAILGIARRPRAEQKIAWRVLGVAAGLAIVAVIGFGVAGISARPSLEEGQRVVRRGIEQIKDGELDKARSSFQRAATLLSSAADDLGRPWTVPARLIPALAQNRNASVELAESATSMARTVTDVLGVVNYDALRMVNGRIDIAAIRALEAPLARLDAALKGFTQHVDDADSQWLASPFQHKLGELRDDVADQQKRSNDVRHIVQVAPELLGADRPQRYFIAFTTPAEARGLGGFMGNWAELTITDGHFEMTRFGRTADLEEAMAPGTRLTGPADFLAAYGGYGFTTASGGVGPMAWHNITMPPDFPTVAEVIAELYPQSGGAQLDGVLCLDVYSIAKVISLTGPISIDRASAPITGKNAAEFLLKDQYIDKLNPEVRIDMLEAVARQAIDRLFTSSLPSPDRLIEIFAPMAREGRLMAWAPHQDYEDVFRRAGLDGGRQPPSGPAMMLTLDNGGGNKIDAYLKTSVELSTPRGGTRTATVKLTNTAPSSGLPAYVIRNSGDAPWGTNRILISLYTTSPLSDLTTDRPTSPSYVGEWKGWDVKSWWVDIPSGESTTFRATLEAANESSAPLSFTAPALANRLEQETP